MIEDCPACCLGLNVDAGRPVPEITARLWILKVLTTAMGEATSDVSVHEIDPYLAVGPAAIALAAALILQTWSRSVRAAPKPVVYSPRFAGLTAGEAYLLIRGVAIVIASATREVIHPGIGPAIRSMMA